MVSSMYRSKFAGRVVLEQIGESRWKLIRPITYYPNAEISYHIPAGFITDLASVPRPFRWLVNTSGKYSAAAILHDFLMTQEDVSTATADRVFREAMEDLHVDFLRVWMMWAAVRLAHRLIGSSLREKMQWLIVAVPSVCFLAIPGTVIVVFLAIFWVAGVLVHLVRKAFSRRTHLPSFWLSADSVRKCKERPLRK